MTDQNKKMRLSPENRTTVFGKILSRIAAARFHTRQIAQDELWKRNGAGNPTKRKGYKMEEVVVSQKDGTEITEYRLYKLIDRATVTIKSEVQANTTFGLEPTAQEIEDGQSSTD